MSEEEPKSASSEHVHHKRRKSSEAATLRHVRKDFHETDSPPPVSHPGSSARRDSETYMKENPAHARPRRDSETGGRASAEKHAHEHYDRDHPPPRPRRASESSVGTQTKIRRNSDMEQLTVIEDPSAPVNIGGSAHVGSIVVNTPHAASTANPTAIPSPVPVPVVPAQTHIKPTQAPPAPPPPKNGCERCMASTKGCLENNKMCPSKTGAFEMFTILVDATAILLLVFANVVPWVKSVPPCTNCPQEFTSGAYLAEKGLTVSYGVWTAGQMSNSNFIHVAEYLRYLNTTASIAWAIQYATYYFPPGANMLWTDLNSGNVCQPYTPGYMLWGFAYQLCPYSVTSAVMGTQALLIIACITALFSMLFMIAARKGSSWWAITSTVCSGISFMTALGGLLWFSLWGYTRSHFDAGQGTIPLRAVSQMAETVAGSIIVMPVAASFIWDAGYYFAIFAVVCEIFTTIVSWIVGTERWWWAPDADIVYGPDAWMVDTDPNAPVNYKPTLPELIDLESQSHRQLELRDQLQEQLEHPQEHHMVVLT